MTTPRVYHRPSVTVDLVIFTVLDSDLKVLQITRGEPPFEGLRACPGGHLEVGDPTTLVEVNGEQVPDQGEDLEAAAHRELEEETGLPKGSCFLEQLYTFGALYRDPRGRVVSVAYIALVRPTLAPMVVAGDDAAAVEWRSVRGLFQGPPRLAFDHDQILAKAVERIRGKIDYSTIAFELVPDTFTVGELRAVHEAVKGEKYEAQNFSRRFKRMVTDGVIELAPGQRVTGAHPAKVYRFKR